MASLHSGGVPTTNPSVSPIGWVGDGNVARHFSHYFELQGWPRLSWSRREALSREVAPQQLARDAAKKLGPCSAIWLLIGDAALPAFSQELRAALDAEQSTAKLAHASGALSVNGVSAWHPLMSFAGPRAYALPSYQKMHFVGGPTSLPLCEFLPGAVNPAHRIADELRPLYHAWCAMAGNFSALLWRELFSTFENELGLPRNAAVPYLAQSAANLMQNPHAAVGGPLARGDTAVIDQHLRALGDGPFAAIYRAFVGAYPRIAAAHGDLSAPPSAEPLRSALTPVPPLNPETPS